MFQYVDHSVTAKACAGLNGLKLGGKVLTVVQAIPDASLVVLCFRNSHFQIKIGIFSHI